jgi:low temperature requirement protein LtrA
MVCVNVLPQLPPRLVGVALLGAMATIGLMAASVTETVDRVWAFAVANVALRLILLVLWVYRARVRRRPLARTIVYNGATAVLWLVSVFVPTPPSFVLWGVAILIEVLLLRVGSDTVFRMLRVDVAHASERLGLFMIILMGESVLSLVTALSSHWSLGSAVAALIGLIAVCFIAWGFFVSGGDVIERGLDRLNQQHSIAGLLPVVVLLLSPFVGALVVLGLIAAAVVAVVLVSGLLARHRRETDRSAIRG